MNESNYPKALLIDLDGTLADSLYIMQIAYQIFLKKFNCTPTESEFNKLNGPTLSEIINLLKLKHNIKEDEKFMCEIYNDIIDDLYKNVVPTYGAVELLKKAQENHCIIGIVTSNTKNRTKSWLKQQNLDTFIDFIISSEDVVIGKPDPQIYKKAIEKTNYDIKDIFAVEDSIKGALSATKANLRTFILWQAKNYCTYPEKAILYTSLLEVMNKIFIIN